MLELVRNASHGNYIESKFRDRSLITPWKTLPLEFILSFPNFILPLGGFVQNSQGTFLIGILSLIINDVKEQAWIEWSRSQYYLFNNKLLFSVGTEWREIFCFSEQAACSSCQMNVFWCHTPLLFLHLFPDIWHPFPFILSVVDVVHEGTYYSLFRTPELLDDPSFCFDSHPGNSLESALRENMPYYRETNQIMAIAWGC